ncbi:MAG: c-type cytochrome domain-containing protein [Myxococcota bacterium]|nr:c-type cytochrome domain-containing protein [Myxococcota bacterium]
MRRLFPLALMILLCTACTEPGEPWYDEVYVETCGNGTCGDGEDCDSCESDCGQCPAPVCGDGACDEGEDEASCPDDCATAPTCIPFDGVAAILSSDTAGCTGCHGGSGGLPLDTYEGVMGDGNNGPAVVPGDHQASNLYTKCISDPPFGSVMPIGKDPLSDEELETIANWIDAGAHETCEASTSACGDGTCDDGEDEASCPDDCTPEVPCVDFATVLAVLETYTCTGCHGGSGGLPLGSYEGVMGDGNNGPAVVPGDHLASNLYTKCSDDVPFGTQMPPGAPGPLTADDLQIIADWIDSGANETCD